MGDPTVSAATPVSPAQTAEATNRSSERVASERSSALIAKYTQMANADATVEAPEPAESPAEKAAPARGPGGKFVAKNEKPSAPESPEASEEPSAEETGSAAEPSESDPEHVEEKAEKPARPAMVLARELVDEAMSGDVPDLEKIDRACKLAFGKSFDELPIKAKHWHDFRAHSKAERAKAQRAALELEQRAQRIVSTYEPLAQAKQALDAGDYGKFIELSTGMGINDFQKRLLGKFFGDAKQAPDDPRLTSLQKRLDDYERRDREREEQAQRATAESQQKRALEEHMANLGKALKSDPRFARAASKQAFVDRVFAVQRENYDAAIGKTITPQEAAELVWDELYGGLLDVGEPDRSDQTATSEGITEGRALQPEKQSRKSGRINHSTPTEASGKPKFKSKSDLMLAAIRQAEAEVARENSGIG